MATIQPTGGSGIANLPAASTVSAAAIPTDGLEWGLNVAEATAGDATFNFDNYAQGMASSMASAGFSPSQVSQYINAAYAGYLMDGGNAASEATGALGSGVSTAGMVGNPGTWGSLDLPGQNGAAGVETPEGHSVGLTPSTALSLGAQLGAQPGNINYPQWRANMSADLQRAGYSQTDVSNFMQQFDAGYYGALNGGQTLVQAGADDGAATATSAGIGFDLEGYISQTVTPWLQNTNGISAPALVNEYLDSYRAAYLSGGTSANTSLIAQASEQGADLVASNQPNFNLENYISSSLPGSVPQWNSMTPAQQQMYTNALVAGYLRAGGTQSASATAIGAPGTVSSPVVSGTGSGNTAGAISGNTAGAISGNTAGAISGNTAAASSGNTASSSPSGAPVQAAATVGAFNRTYAASGPGNANSVFQYVNSSNPTLAGDANTLQSSLSSLNATQGDLAYAESAYNLADQGSTGTAADSSGSIHNAGYWGGIVGQLQSQQQGQWNQVRTQEAQFFNDLANTSSDVNASMAAQMAQNYANDPSFSLEGEIPSSWAGPSLSSGTSSGTGAASTPTLAPVSSSAYNALAAITSSSFLPATASNELTDAFASKSISQTDYTQLVQGYMKLFQNSPAAYYQSLANIKDPNLAGAINFGVNDMVINCSKEMVVNGAALSTEQSSIGKYYSLMQANPATFYGWAPPPGAQNYSGPTDIDGIVKASMYKNNPGDIESILKDPNATGSNHKNGKMPNHYSDASQMMASLYKNNRGAYYQVLSDVADPRLADMLNRDVQLEFQRYPKSYGDHGNGAADTDFQHDWANDVGLAGATAGSTATDAGIGFNTSSPTNGD